MRGGNPQGWVSRTTSGPEGPTGPPGTTDHGALTGLADDDHAQYHTDARALTWLLTRSTTDLAEGTNLYYTAARVLAIAQALDVDLTEIAAVANVRGDLLVTDVTPSWVRLALGTSGKFLKAGASDPSWESILSTDLSDFSSAVIALLTNANIPNDLTLDNITQITTRAHTSLTGFTTDDHTIYALLLGRAGGQTIIGGTASGNKLILTSTSHATKGGVEVTDEVHHDEIVSLSSSAGVATVNWTTGNVQKITLTENVSTMNFTAPGGPAHLTLKITQDAAPRTIAWPASVKWPAGTAPTLSSGNADVDLIVFLYDNVAGAYYGQAAQDFS